MNVEGERRLRCEAANDHGVVTCRQCTHDLSEILSAKIICDTKFAEAYDDHVFLADGMPIREVM